MQLVTLIAALKEAYKFFQKGNFASAKERLEFVIRSIPLCVADGVSIPLRVGETECRGFGRWRVCWRAT